MTTPWDPGTMPSDPEDIPPGPTSWQDPSGPPADWEDDTPAAAAASAPAVGERGGAVDLERL
ncbi:hypothetical protein FH969_14830, partial [Miniimonas arenae]